MRAATSNQRLPLRQHTPAQAQLPKGRPRRRPARCPAVRARQGSPPSPGPRCRAPAGAMSGHRSTDHPAPLRLAATIAVRPAIRFGRICAGTASWRHQRRWNPQSRRYLAYRPLACCRSMPLRHRRQLPVACFRTMPDDRGARRPATASRPRHGLASLRTVCALASRPPCEIPRASLGRRPHGQRANALRLAKKSPVETSCRTQTHPSRERRASTSMRNPFTFVVRKRFSPARCASFIMSEQSGSPRACPAKGPSSCTLVSLARPR